jgi:hypothetical protein
MKKVSIILISTMLALLSGCQDHNINPPVGVNAWIADGTGPNDGKSIAVDANGNVYVAGFFNGSITLGTTTLTSNGKNDIFIVKYNSIGEVQWAQKGGGEEVDEASDISVDKDGNVYVTGHFTGLSTFGTKILQTQQLKSDAFVLKYDKDGVIQWAIQAGGTSADEGAGIAVDGEGNVLVAGSFEGTATFGAIQISGTFMTPEVFIAKYTSNGDVQWVQKGGGTSIDQARDVSVDNAGNVFVTGIFFGNAEFGTSTLVSRGQADIFVAKYNSSGGLIWVHSSGSVTNDDAKDIIVDSNGNSYITGFFFQTATFNTTNLTALGNSDIFIAKYRSTGDLEWVHQAGGIGIDGGEGLAMDGEGNVYLTGAFQNTAAFFGGQTVTSNNLTIDAFIAKYNSSGNVLWVQKAGGFNTDVGNGIAVDKSKNAYVTGFFEQSFTFGATTFSSSGDKDMFVIKYKE